jgi:hypothetical protein
LIRLIQTQERGEIICAQLSALREGEQIYDA